MRRVLVVCLVVLALVLGTVGCKTSTKRKARDVSENICGYFEEYQHLLVMGSALALADAGSLKAEMAVYGTLEGIQLACEIRARIAAERAAGDSGLPAVAPAAAGKP